MTRLTGSSDDAALRPMQPGDADALARLEALSEETPWTRGNFLDSLAAGHICLVLELEGRIAAWAAASAALDEGEILIIGTAPELRRRGFGSRLLAAAEEALCRAGAERIFLEVRESNLPAIGLYRKAGYEAVGRRRGYYRTKKTASGREDALLMKKEMPAPGIPIRGEAQ